MTNKHYGGIIWTNHALDRLSERGFPQDLAWQAFSSPDHSHPGKRAGTTEFRKKVENSTITVIAKPNEKKEWIVLSCWIDPPLYGTKDYKKKQDYLNYKRAGFWGKVWYGVKSQLGF